MILFPLSSDAIQAAEDNCNAHLSRQIVNCALILSHFYPPYGPDRSYKMRRPFLPWVAWALRSRNSALWVYYHGASLCDEYQRRFDSSHKSQPIISGSHHWLRRKTHQLSDDTQPFPLTVPEAYRSPDTVRSFQLYYFCEKYELADWHGRCRPTWWRQLEDSYRDAVPCAGGDREQARRWLVRRELGTGERLEVPGIDLPSEGESPPA